MNLSQLQDEEKKLLARLGDLFSLSRAKHVQKFSSFLDERQAMIAQEYARQNRLDSWMLFGGRENAARQVFGVFPDYEKPSQDAFPITAITAKFPQRNPLSHRDFLGSLMALKIARESIGDLLVSPGRCDFFVLSPVAHSVLDELKKVGSTGVTCAVSSPGDFVVLEEFQELRGTVASKRIDCLIAMLLNISREKASVLIREGRVRQNFTDVISGAREFMPDDTFSIRGYGRFIIDKIEVPTKKGRLPVRCRQYK